MLTKRLLFLMLIALSNPKITDKVKTDEAWINQILADFALFLPILSALLFKVYF